MDKDDGHIPEWTIHTKAKNSVFAQDELWTIMDGEKLIAVVYDYGALALFIDAPDLLRQRDALHFALDNLFAWALQQELLNEHDDELVNQVKQALAATDNE